MERELQLEIENLKEQVEALEFLHKSLAILAIRDIKVAISALEKRCNGYEHKKEALQLTSPVLEGAGMGDLLSGAGGGGFSVESLGKDLGIRKLSLDDLMHMDGRCIWVAPLDGIGEVRENPPRYFSQPSWFEVDIKEGRIINLRKGYYNLTSLDKPYGFRAYNRPLMKEKED